MNRNLGLSAAIEEDPNVIPAGRLYRYVGGMRGETWAEGVMRALISVCLDDDNGRIVLDGLYRSIPTEDKRKVAAVLSELDTWDRLDLHGGRQLQGDARAIIVDGEKIPLEDFPRL